MTPSRVLADELACWVSDCLAAVPGRTGIAVRQRWLALTAGAVGSSLSVGRGCDLLGVGNMHFGDRVAIGAGCHLSARQGTLTIGSDTSLNTNVCLGADFGEIAIGRDVLIAMNVVMRSANHRFDQSPQVAIRSQGHVGAPIVIGDDVWIGANAVITAGVRVGNHCVIGAGSVVTGDIPDNSIAVGVPARVVRGVGSKAQDACDAR